MRTLRYTDHIDPFDNVAILRQHCLTTGAPGESHTHEFIEIVYCFEGEGVQVLDGREYPMRGGTLLFLNYGQAHRFYSVRGMSYYDFLLTPSFISESLINSVDAFSLLSLTAFSDLHISDFIPIIVLTGREMLEVRHLADRMECEFTDREPGYRAIIAGYMTVLFSMMFRKMALPVETDGAASKGFNVGEVVRYIEEHLSEKINLAELAKRSFYNPSYFSRLFKAYSGQNLTDFIHRKRVERAAELLKVTNLSVEHVSEQVGYSDVKQFYRQFKQYTGITPGLARKRV